MVADLPLDLWLDTQQQPNRQTIVPYVRSAEPTTLHYRIELVRQSQGGNSQIQQSGQLTLVADQPAALTTLSAGGTRPDTCRLSITLKPANQAATRYQFDCND